MEAGHGFCFAFLERRSFAEEDCRERFRFWRVFVEVISLKLFDFASDTFDHFGVILYVW